MASVIWRKVQASLGRRPGMISGDLKRAMPGVSYQQREEDGKGHLAVTGLAGLPWC